MANDWIKLHRKLLEHPIMQHDGLCRLWNYLLLRANWKDNQWLIPGTTKAISVPRGSLVLGRQSLHQALYPRNRKDDPAPFTVWRWLISLADMECITVRNVCNHCSVVTIVNYEGYQGREDEQCAADEQPMSNRRATDEQPARTLEEGKKVEEGKKESMSADADPAASAADVPKGLARLIQLWNEIDGVQRCRAATPKRIASFRQRATRADWMESVKDALDQVAKSDFCRGHNDRVWLADIDWFLKPDTVTKIREGKYDNRNSPVINRVATIPATGTPVYNPETGEIVIAKE
jgi:hypothetical protein